MTDTIIQLKDISKSFGVVNVLNGINMTIERGKVYALAGENGAGKSTLCNIISGSLKPSGGSLVYNNKSYDHFTIEQSKEIGIRMVHQELQLLPLMTVAENIFIGDEVVNKHFIDEEPMMKRTQELLDLVNLPISPDTKVGDVDIAGRQMIEISRAIKDNASIIILDEPTSSLTKAEIKTFFEIINKLKQQGVSFIFISHRLEEVFEISDSIIVLKDGELVAELDAKESNENEVIQLMVGRSYSDFYNRHRSYEGEEVLRVENLSASKDNHVLNAYLPKDISFSLYAGEVLGIYGLVGAGRTELIKTIFGDFKCESGNIYVNGEKVEINNSADAIEMGLAWVTEDRKDEGVIIDSTIKFNMSLPIIKNFKDKIFINDFKVNNLTEKYIDRLNIKTTGGNQKVKNLSGGNQQKVVLAKWLATNPKILILDEPTRGIDVGAKAEIYKLINQLTSEGVAVLLISSELPELIGMSDRVLTMYEGEITGEIQRDEFSEEKILEYATGRKVS